MKTNLSFLLLSGILALFSGCTSTESETGFVKFEAFNPNVTQPSLTASLRSETIPALTGHSTETTTQSFFLAVGDVWVSQDEVKAGNADNLNWIRLMESTNRIPKMFEEYTFASREVPAGTYKSIKITFKNVFYRYLQLVSDTSVHYKLMETMGSWTAPCSEEDTSWAETNYFSEAGNHRLEDGHFRLVAPGEKIGGFEIQPKQTTTLKWRLWAGQEGYELCRTYLIDENDNRIWDCGTDRMDFYCPPTVQYMWDFVTE